MEHKKLTTLGLLAYNLLTTSWVNAEDLEREAEDFHKKLMAEVAESGSAIGAKNTPNQAQGQTPKRGRGRPKKTPQEYLVDTDVPVRVITAAWNWDKNERPVYVHEMADIKIEDLLKRRYCGAKSIKDARSVLARYGVKFADDANYSRDLKKIV